jgi:MFS family permease
VPTSPEDERDTGPPAALRLIRSRRFGAYFFGNALSAMGLWFHNLAAAILLYRLTESEVLLGVLAFTQFGPTLFLVSVAGSVADRFDRRRVIIASQVVATVMAGALAILAAVDAAPVPVILLLSLGIGIAQAFVSPAAGAMIAALVEPRDLGSAVALNSMTFNLARALGPALAALVVTTLGIPAAFAINAVSYVALAVGVTIANPPRRPARSGGATRLRDTVALIRREPHLGAYLFIVMIVGFASDPINTLAPAYALAFGRPDTDAGLIIGVFGLGAIAAAFVVSGRAAPSRRRLGITMLLLGGSVALFSVTPSLPLALAILALAGFAYLSSNAGTTSRLQLEVDDDQRGRIMALWSVAFLGLRPVASLLDGTLAHVFGVRVAGVVLATPAILVALVLLAGPDVRARMRARASSPA